MAAVGVERCPICKRPRPQTIGGPDDTVDDRVVHTPALQFEDRYGLVWLVKADGTSYAFAGRKDLPRWLAYYRRMADALDEFLYPVPPEEWEAAPEDDIVEPEGTPEGDTSNASAQEPF